MNSASFAKTISSALTFAILENSLKTNKAAARGTPMPLIASKGVAIATVPSATTKPTAAIPASFPALETACLDS